MLTHDTAESRCASEDFPEHWQQGQGLTFPISYHFEPGAADDGLTIDVPVATLNRVAADDFSWNVPGVRHELVTSLIRSLPKNLRVSFVPAPDKAREFLAATPPGEEPLLDALERWARSTTGVVVPRDAWDWSKVPAHLQPTYRVLDDDGLPSTPAARTSTRSRRRWSRSSTRPSPRSPTTAGTARPARPTGRSASSRRRSPSAGPATRCSPTRPCSTRATTVGLGVFGSAEEAVARHRLGVRRLLLLALPFAERPHGAARHHPAARPGGLAVPHRRRAARRRPRRDPHRRGRRATAGPHARGVRRAGRGRPRRPWSRAATRSCSRCSASWPTGATPTGC